MEAMSQMRKFSGLTGPVFNVKSTIKPAGVLAGQLLATVLP